MAQETFDNFRTIKQAREDLFKAYDIGEHCPVCGQYVKKYKRKITSSMAYALILLYWRNEAHPGEWIHILEYFRGKKGIPHTLHGDCPKLRYWELIIKKDEAKEDGNPDSGYYKITRKGFNFVKDMITVPKFIYLYNNEFLAFGGELINIKEALGNKFDYGELMTDTEME